MKILRNAEWYQIVAIVFATDFVWVTWKSAHEVLETDGMEYNTFAAVTAYEEVI